MIFVVKVQLKKLSARFLFAFLITKAAFLPTNLFSKLKINQIKGLKQNYYYFYP